MAPYLATLHIGRYEDIDVSASPITIRATLPADLVPAFEVAFARQAEMVEVFSSGSARTRSTPATAWSSRDDPLEIPLEAQGMADVRGQPPRRHPRAPHRPRARPPVVRQQRHRGELARHLAARRLRLLRRVGVVGGVGRTPGRAARGRAPRPARRPAAGPRARRPGCRRTCSTTASTSAAPSRCTPCASVSATRRFFQLLRRWVKEHQHRTVTTADFVALAEQLAGASLDELFGVWLYERPLPPLTTAID